MESNKAVTDTFAKQTLLHYIHATSLISDPGGVFLKDFHEKTLAGKVLMRKKSVMTLQFEISILYSRNTKPKELP